MAGVFIAGMLNASLTLLAGGTVGGEAATAQAVVESAGSQSGVVRGGVLAFTEASERVENFHRDFQEESGGQ